MSDEKNHSVPPASVPPTKPANSTATADLRPFSATFDAGEEGEMSAGDAGGDIPIAQMRAIIEVLQADLDEARRELDARTAEVEAADEKVLRSYAEIENMRKRVEREKEDTAKYAITKLARDIVMVADNFERAIASVPQDARTDNPALTSLLEGVTLTEREFLKTLERHGVKRIAPHGEPFNPHQHQAVMEQANPDVPSGTVLQVFQVGYLIEDRILRPAMVVVATGGPKQVKPSETQDPADDASEIPEVGEADGRG